MKFLNQIIAAILLTFVIIFGINKLSDIIYKVETPKTAFKVESKTVSQTSEKKSVEESIGISALLAMGSVEHGARKFSACKSCHSIKSGNKHAIGPGLYNIFSKKIGKQEGYKYSKALASSDKEWNFENMNLWLISPKDFIPNNKMMYRGMSSEKDRSSIILFLNENSDNPLQLP